MSSNPIQDKVNSLVSERATLQQEMRELESRYEKCKERIIEIGGSINVLVELFRKEEPEESSQGTEVVMHDPENKTESRTNSNQG